MIAFVFTIASAVLLLLIFRQRLKKLPKKHLAELVPSGENEPPPEGQMNNALGAENLNYGEINRAYRIADMHFARGDFEEAEKWFIKVLALHEYHPEALNRLGVIYIQQKNARRAEILYQKLFTVTQKEPAYYANYGRCLYNQGRLAESLEAYENAIKLDASRPSRFVSIGQIYYEQKNYLKALAHFVRAAELDPRNVEYLSVVAQLSELAGDQDRLHKSLRKILEIDPYNEMAKKKLEGLVAI